jgi:hypothetical protein
MKARAGGETEGSQIFLLALLHTYLTCHSISKFDLFIVITSISALY